MLPRLDNFLPTRKVYESLLNELFAVHCAVESVRGNVYRRRGPTGQHELHGTHSMAIKAIAEADGNG